MMRQPHRLLIRLISAIRGFDGPVFCGVWRGGPKCGYESWLGSPPKIGDRLGLFVSKTDKRRHEWEYHGEESADGEFFFNYIGLTA